MTLCKKYSLSPITTNLRWHKTREKDVVEIATFDLIGLLPTNHIIIIISYNGLQEFMRKRCKRAEIFNIVRRSSQLKWGYKMANWRLSRRFHTLMWRPWDTVQNLKSPRLYGRVDSTAVCLTVFQSPLMLFEKNAWEKYLFDMKLVLLVLCW